MKHITISFILLVSCNTLFSQTKFKYKYDINVYNERNYEYYQHMGLNDNDSTHLQFNFDTRDSIKNNEKALKFSVVIDDNRTYNYDTDKDGNATIKNPKFCYKLRLFENQDIQKDEYICPNKNGDQYVDIILISKKKNMIKKILSRRKLNDNELSVITKEIESGITFRRNKWYITN